MSGRRHGFRLRRPVGRPRGFTLVELLVVLVLAGVIVIGGVPLLRQMIHRTKLETISRELSVLMQSSRLSAIRESRNALVLIDTSSTEMVAFVDGDEDGARSATEKIIGPIWLPSGISFADPDGNEGISSVFGFPAVGDLATVTFRADGSSAVAGALRFGDYHDNFLEVAVTSRTTGQIEVRKWNGTDWVAPGEGGGPWQWH